MARLVRKCFLALAVVSFMAMTTGITLQLHLLSHEHSHEHDIDNCLFCQQLITLGKFNSEPQPSVDNIDQFEYILDDCPDTFFVSSQPKPFNCRPPPSVS